MIDSLRARALRGSAWSLVEQATAQGIQFLITVVMARLLTPEDFGLMGMLGIFIVLSQSVLDAGLGMALIRKPDATHLDECSVFYFNLAMGGLLAALFHALAPAIAAFYRQPALADLTRAMSALFVLQSLGSLQSSLLVKGLHFKRQTLISMGATAVSGTVGILAAWRGCGVWSLVYSTLTFATVRSLLLWIGSPWRPARRFSGDALRQLFAFGSRILSAGLLNQAFDELYSVVIGRFFSAGELGFYTRARRLQQLAVNYPSDALNRVCFPLFAQLQGDPARLAAGFRRALEWMIAAQFGLLAGLVVTGKPLIVSLFSARWQGSVLFFQLLCAAGLLYPVHLLNMSALQALGQARLFLRLEFIKKGLLLVVLLATVPFGITALVAGQVAVSLLALLINAGPTGRLVGCPLRRQAALILRYLVPALLAAAVTWGAGQVLVALPLRWLPQLAVCALTYLGLCHLLGLRAPAQLWSQVRTHLGAGAPA